MVVEAGVAELNLTAEVLAMALVVFKVKAAGKRGEEASGGQREAGLGPGVA